MYNYQMTVKEKSNRNESTFKYKKIQSAITDLNGCRGVSFVIKRLRDNRMMMSGNK